MGLALLANLSAYDFGYLDAPACILGQRTANTLRHDGAGTVHQGTFYNWYDTNL